MSQNKKIKFWDDLAKKEAKKFEREPESYQKTLDILEKYLSPELQVFDFACGNGRIALPIANKVAHITGLDISAGMIELAQRDAQKQGLSNLSFVQGTLDDIEIPKDSFDLVVASNILHLLDQPQSAIAKIHQSLKPGGIFVSTTAIIGEGKYWLKAIVWLITQVNLVPKIQYFTNEKVEGLMSQYFDIIERDENPGTFSDLYLVGRKL